MELDLKYMALAFEQAKLAGDAGEVPVGAIIVKEDEVIGIGHNSMIANNDPTAHAEIVAIRAACNKVENYRLPETTLYVTLEPCTMCMGALIQARISRLVFGAYDPKTGAAGSLYNIGSEGELNHLIAVTGGLMLDDCSKLLKDFFKQRRKDRKAALASA